MPESGRLDPACDHLRPIILAEPADGNSFLRAPAEWNTHLTFWLSGYRLEQPRPRVATVRYVYDPDPRNGWIDYYACRTHSQTVFRQPVSLAAGHVMMPWEIDEALHERLLGSYPAHP